MVVRGSSGSSAEGVIGAGVCEESWTAAREDSRRSQVRRWHHPAGVYPEIWSPGEDYRVHVLVVVRRRPILQMLESWITQHQVDIAASGCTICTCMAISAASDRIHRLVFPEYKLLPQSTKVELQGRAVGIAHGRQTLTHNTVTMVCCSDSMCVTPLRVHVCVEQLWSLGSADFICMPTSRVSLRQTRST